MQLLLAREEYDYRHAKALFQEYANEIGISLDFQDFDKELADLQSMYGQPSGGLILLFIDGVPVGCVGVSSFEGNICELKRMYIKGSFRSIGYGKMLLDHALSLAKSLGYKSIRLDTLATMKTANKLYIDAGFVEIPPFRFNPHPNTIYFEKEL